MRRLLTIVTFLVTFVGCSVHSIKSRPIVGTLGRQCASEPRIVFCKKGMDKEDCQLVEEAVWFINNSYKNVQFFKFGGWTEGEFFKDSTRENLIVGYVDEMVRLSPFEAIRVAETLLRVDGYGCILYTMIRVYVPRYDMTTGARISMFRHELLHALGVPHAMWGSDGLMLPSGDAHDEMTAELSDAELNILDAIYGGSR